jgi:hypothetical protein
MKVSGKDVAFTASPFATSYIGSVAYRHLSAVTQPTTQRVMNLDAVAQSGLVCRIAQNLRRTLGAHRYDLTGTYL